LRNPGPSAGKCQIFRPFVSQVNPEEWSFTTEYLHTGGVARRVPVLPQDPAGRKFLIDNTADS
jgi:hypothetical protein